MPKRPRPAAPQKGAAPTKRRPHAVTLFFPKLSVLATLGFFLLILPMITNPSSSSIPATTPIRLAITTGEPAGVGPELMYHLTTQAPWQLPLSAHTGTQSNHFESTPIELVLIGNKKLLQERMQLWPQHHDFVLHDFNPDHFAPTHVDAHGCGHISILDVPLPAKAIAGTLNSANASYVLATLDQAITLYQKHICAGIVTAPISKSVIAQQGITFTGHTEYLEEKTHSPEVVMLLGCVSMNVALVTTHLPLKDVSAAITPEKLSHVIRVLHTELRHKMGFAQPKIFVCGINPHAGEDGTLGKEEQQVMIPVLNALRAEGMELIGPLPADSIFQPKYLKEAAVILTMYHDQGLPVLKYVGFDSGYNTTLGLPFIRTSVDHGTALDLAGKACADAGSLKSAVSLAIYMAKQQQRTL